MLPAKTQHLLQQQQTLATPSIYTQCQNYRIFLSEVEEELSNKRTVFGICQECGKEIIDARDSCQALEKLYHASCFTCVTCGRPLRGKKFYCIGSKMYCVEDYMYSGFQHAAKRCHACNHLIVDHVLQAVGKFFHPNCFRCAGGCGQCLDGLQFVVASDEQVYCVRDYHRLFAPRCNACGLPIIPDTNSEETVRVVSMNKDYHVDCFCCFGCGVQLTDEVENRCHPLGNYLLCQACHIHWARTGGTLVAISDL